VPVGSFPSVRVHIASYNTVHATELCVRSARLTERAPFQLLVGDGGSSDDTIRMLSALSARYGVEVEHGGRRSHADWLDRWTSARDVDYLVFVDSDVEFRRPGWLSEMVEVAQSTGAALVAAELLPEVPGYVEPLLDNLRMRVMPRPSPWLLLLDARQMDSLGAVSFHGLHQPDRSAEEGHRFWDVGGAVMREVTRQGLTWTIMPATFRRSYHHYGNVTWADASKGGTVLARRRDAAIRRRLAATRALDSGSRWARESGRWRLDPRLESARTLIARARGRASRSIARAR
jgi:glycosyltransferase involved in cell wall biosynthesis